MRETADVVIVGGGVMGCSLQYHLARQGATRTLLLERKVLGAGSTGLSQAICRMHYSNPVTASMAWDSLQVYANFAEQVGGDSGFVQTGYLVVVEEIDRPGLELNIAMQQELGINVGLVTASELRELAPMMETYEGEGMAWEPDSGYANPYLVTNSYAERSRELGAEIATRVAATGIEIAGRSGPGGGHRAGTDCHRGGSHSRRPLVQFPDGGYGGGVSPGSRAPPGGPGHPANRDSARSPHRGGYCPVLFLPARESRPDHDRATPRTRWNWTITMKGSTRSKRKTPSQGWSGGCRP